MCVEEVACMAKGLQRLHVPRCCRFSCAHATSLWMTFKK